MGGGDLLQPQAESERQQVFGVVIGVVTENKDEEGRGRMKVSFPWRGDGTESYWARMATPMAGGKRGMVFFPEKDEEVLVAFEQGDINRPYIIGALWNGVDKPPETNSDGKNNIRTIRSRSGHELTFDDADGKEKVIIKTKGGQSITLDDKAGEPKIEITDGKSNTVLIESSSGAITVKCAQQLKISAMMVEIEGTTSLTLKSNGPMTIQGMPVKIN
jgi:uncharacterized protein involved in type VI secretion and phage assembly